MGFLPKYVLWFCVFEIPPAMYFKIEIALQNDKALKAKGGGCVCLADTSVKYLFNGQLKVITALGTSAHPYLTEKHSLGREK